MDSIKEPLELGCNKPPARMTERGYALFYEIFRALLQKIIINLDLHLLQL